MADRHTRFAFDLLRVMAKDGENVVLSPWSVSSAFAVLAPGCDEPARHEIETALGSRPEELAADAAEVVDGLDIDDATLVVVNTLWVDANRTGSPTFVPHLERWPGAVLRSIPMMADPDGARRTINADVGTTTRNLIPEILPPGSITPEERAVIVNALYLLVAWMTPFHEASTIDEPFQAPGGARDVPTMRGVRTARYATNTWEYLVLPLRRGLQAEILIPPTSEEPPPDLDDLRAAATPHEVDLHLPRFRIGSTCDLGEPLEQLGVRRIFDSASLPVSDVVAEEPLYVSTAVHAAVLRVDETGIEGAAATAIVMAGVAYQALPRVEVRVDRPFLFLVTHRATGAVLFLARVNDP